MNTSSNKSPPLLALVTSFFLAFAVSGCEDGDNGRDGVDGVAGPPGQDGFSCWDLNENGVADPDEDLNGDGTVDVFDCNPTASGAYGVEALHSGYFTEHSYDGTQSCLNCHGLDGIDFLETAHFKWEGVASGIEGFEGEYHGKNDLINNFCIAVPTNEGRCTQCHAGYGYDDDTFAFNDMESVDCLVCHDQSGTYAKGPKTAGAPVPTVDLDIVARSVAQNGGVPSRKNCIGCHANAGGGDNVKHGDLAMSLVDTTREFDVHMGVDGGDMNCVACHDTKKDMDGKLVDHGIGGMPYHSVEEGNMKGCVDCHGDAPSIHVGATVENIVSTHSTLACQVCHIPAIARDTPTKTEWYWEDAGQDVDPIPIDEATGQPLYNKMKGTFAWAKDLRPELLYYDGKWERAIIGANDEYDSLPANLGAPSATYETPGAMIYPFKKMIGNQPADANNGTILVPHLFGMKGGPNPYWVKYDWQLALEDGAAYTGQEFTGEYEFIDTYMFLTVNHEVAPKEQAFGYESDCADCHFEGKINWQGLGWTGDPVLEGSTRP